MMRKSHFSFLLVAIVFAIAMIAVPTLSATENPSSTLRTSRVVAQINENQVVTLGGHLAPWASSANDLGAAPDSMKLDLQLMLKRSDAQESALQTLLAEQQDRQSANYRKWLTPEDFGARFGISDSDLAKVTAWMTSHGFVINRVATANNVIRFSATNGQLQEALHTQLHRYRVGSEVHYANASNPTIPAALAPVITGFYGLNDMKPKPLHTTPGFATRKKGDTAWQVRKTTPAASDPSSGASPLFELPITSGTTTTEYHLLAPSDFATIYSVAPLYDQYDGTGQTIAIVAQSDINPTDVDTFRNNFNLPTKKLNIIYDGPNPGINLQAEGEADLDVEWSGGIAKNATIDLVVASDVVNAIQYSVDNNLAPVLSISWGLCELGLQTSGNTFFTELYKQASSQGITVLVATGDASAATCDEGSNVSTFGLTVSGFASTPYNVAVGGTDFPVNVLGTATKYWNTTNSPADLHSAKSYIPEAPWNDSCASPFVLERAQTYSQWAADATNEQFCNDPTATSGFLSLAGGGGGVSNCTDTDTYDITNCTGGHPQPGWQTGVPGVPADSSRHIPDVSFFAGPGLWRTGYVFCESDANPDGTCSAADLEYSYAGGTSFAAPSFAGIVALLNQKTNSRLGNINYTLYHLAASQFNDPTKKSACQVTATNGTDTGCVFHDITQGTNRVPCVAGSVDNAPNGTCTPTLSTDTYGILSGFDAGVGYDMASGLGSINAFNLFNSWPGSLASAQTTLTLTTGANLSYGVKVGGTVTVTGASGTPTGPVTLMYKDSNGNALGGLDATDLVNGAATLAPIVVPVGNYSLYARYSGDQTYGSSASAGQAVTISPAATTVALSASRTSVAALQSTLLQATVMVPSWGNSPTGNVIFKNATTGSVLGTVAVSGYTDSSTGYSYAQATIDLGASSLAHGDNQITATFSGDTNYSGATGSALDIKYTGGFTIAASSTSLTLSPGAASGNTVVFTVTPGSGETLSPASIQFLCPGTLPAGVSCQFSTPTAASNGTITSTMTVLLNSSLTQSAAAPLHPLRGELSTALAMMIFGWVCVPARRKRPAAVALWMVLVLLVPFSSGCSGSGNKPTAPTIATTLTASSASPAPNSPVTLNATLSNSAATGTISFFDGTQLLGNTAVSQGAASITTSSLPMGANTLTAIYSGDTTYPAATSVAVTVDVTFTSTITAQAVASDGNFAQQQITLTVK